MVGVCLNWILCSRKSFFNIFVKYYYKRYIFFEFKFKKNVNVVKLIMSIIYLVVCVIV